MLGIFEHKQQKTTLIQLDKEKLIAYLLSIQIINDYLKNHREEKGRTKAFRMGGGMKVVSIFYKKVSWISWKKIDLQLLQAL